MSQLSSSIDAAEHTPEAKTETVTKRTGIGRGGIIAIAVILVIGTIFALGLKRQQSGQPTDGAAPNFTLQTFEGNSISLTDLRGQVVVINFWASWCGPCQYEAPELQATWEQYKDKGVVFLGVAYTDTEREALKFLAKHGITYINGLDFKTAISELYGITGVPETFIVDRQGNVSAFYPSPLTQTQLSKLLDEALKQS